MKKLLYLFLVMLTVPVYAQNSAINAIRDRYYDWLTGGSVDYNRAEIMIRYNYILGGYNSATNLSAFDFNNPGAVWDLTNNADKNEFKAISTKLYEMCVNYQVMGPSTNPNPHYQDANLLSTILDCFDYLAAKGINGTTFYGNYYSSGTPAFGLGSTSILRSASYAHSVFLMRDELMVHGAFNHHQEALDNISWYYSPSNPNPVFSVTGSNADGVKSIGEVRLVYILNQLDTETDRIANMEHYVDFLNNALEISPGWADFVKPDYITFHHSGAYPSSYGATATMAASLLQYALDDSPYELSQTYSDNVREVLLAYGKYTHGYSMSSMLTGRGPTNTDGLLELPTAMANSFLCDPIENIEAGEEFTRLFLLDSTLITNKLIKKKGVGVSLYHTLGGMQLMLDVLDQNLTPAEVKTGSYAFPYAGLSTHKGNGWMVSQKGTSKHVWHTELNNTQNVYGRYTSAANMEIMNSNEPLPRAASGLVWDGWDWSLRPGSTTHYLTLSELELQDDRLLNSKDFLVNATFKKHGVFSMDYEDMDAENLMTVLKSTFFFDDYLVCIASNIEGVDSTHRIKTCLFQTALSDTANYTYVNSDSITGLQESIYTNTDNGFTDAAGNAFYVHQMDGQDSIYLTRRHQQSIEQNGSTPSDGYFITSWVDHGILPTTTPLIYLVQVNGGKSAASALPSNFNNLFTVHQSDSIAHIVEYLGDSTTSIALFNENTSFTHGYIKASDNVGVIQYQKESATKLRLGFTDPNLGLFDDHDWYPYSQFTFGMYYTIPTHHDVTITVDGEWVLDSASNDVSLYFNGIDTEVTFSSKNGLSHECLLQEAGVNVEEVARGQYSVWPTLCNEQVNYQGENVENIYITSNDGRLIRKVPGNNQRSINLEGLTSGMYHITLESGQHQESFKIIKQ